MKKSYKFAVGTAALYSFIQSVCIFLAMIFFENLQWLWLLATAAVSFLLVFGLVQYRIEYFIYKKVKQIYDDLTLLESTSLVKDQITTDMTSLTQEIDKYARNKKLEIETLKIRETYRKEFIGNVSHELKTPLFTVQGYISTLIDGAKNDPELLSKYLKGAEKGVERLTFIVKDLDMITQLEAGIMTLDKTEFDILEVVKNVFELCEMKANRKNISLIFVQNYKDPIRVRGDQQRLQQVVSNLIVNSIKYGSQNGTTEVAVENLTKNKVIVRITDNGEGIDKFHIPRIFERFYRVNNNGSRKEGGSGLGLAIVKHILEAHDEKLFVESAVDTGSEFSFTLTKASAPPQ
ncbi:MAG: ATP-binding protein [Bacteroidetes bacterium]|nr:ATP-binding protein [Bacteroidota bacterium]MDA0879270.1 ATP-binding protein [Bacteroidota bacterium]MDA1114879.1 ATP-binding protein [Bacteroidota bacterium]